MKQVVVVIPVYKTDLKETEVIALERCKTVLKNYPIVLVAPEGLQASYMEGFETAYFDINYFTNIAGYNELLMSKGFYERFAMYEFMLICQLDALVLKDELAYWCEKGYDYIGATWLDKDRNVFRRVSRNIRTWLYLNALRGKQNADAGMKMGYATHNQVGNGGFSLRRISAMLRVVEAYPTWIRRILEAKIPEDVFFSILINLYQPKKLQVATYKAGIAFAFEMHPQKAYKINGNNLPFGCHDFDDWENDFWQNILKDLDTPQN